jgi:hypothetical protein
MKKWSVPWKKKTCDKEEVGSSRADRLRPCGHTVYVGQPWRPEYFIGVEPSPGDDPQV